jgi:hypothetical protein
VPDEAGAGNDQRNDKRESSGMVALDEFGRKIEKLGDQDIPVCKRQHRSEKKTKIFRGRI